MLFIVTVVVVFVGDYKGGSYYRKMSGSYVVNGVLDDVPNTGGN